MLPEKSDLSCLHINLDRETELCIPWFETYTVKLYNSKMGCKTPRTERDVCRGTEGCSSWLLLACLQCCPWALILPSAGQRGLRAPVLYPEHCSGPCSSALLCLPVLVFFFSPVWKPYCCLSEGPLSRVLDNAITGTDYPFKTEQKGENPVAFPRYCFTLPASGFSLVSHS